MSALRVETYRGDAFKPHLDALAQLRIEVFREWPYLYAGTLDYERRYLQTYLRCAESLVILVWDDGRCVGASTALPLEYAETEMQAPFVARGIEIKEVDYFGESIVLKPWRGRGLGVKFFSLREAHAASLKLSTSAFCAVERSEDHPAKPADYVTNDAFWLRRGYRKQDDMRCRYEWIDVGDDAATRKSMQFWLKQAPF